MGEHTSADIRREVGHPIIDADGHVLEVLDAVDRVTNRTIDRVLSPRRAGDPGSLVSDPSLLKATLPWQPVHDRLDEIVAHALAWERKLGELRPDA